MSEPVSLSIPSVAVIGAGISGLSCAQTLQAGGLKVHVFDKSRGPGGRMSTRRTEDWQCDHGAQYFTARDPAFRAEVARWCDRGVAQRWTPRLHVMGERPRSDARGGSLGRGADVGREHSPERFVGVPRMTAPARFMADSLDLATQATIKQLTRSQTGWRIATAERGWLEQTFDAVVVAVPAPQAAPLLGDSAPGLAYVAGSAVMRGCWSLMLQFDGSAISFDAAFINDGPLRWIARDTSKPGRSGKETWLLHASPEWSEAHIEDQAADVAKTLLAAFAALGGPEPDRVAPQAWTAHRWRYADSAPAYNNVCIWRHAFGLGLCGDWLNGGKVEGAWLSGRVLAQQILQSLKPDIKNDLEDEDR